jgi:hypothetical protein
MVSDCSACKEAKMVKLCPNLSKEEVFNIVSSLKYNLNGEVILDNEYLYLRLG